MKTIALMLLLALPALACKDGCFEYSGVCACDQKPKSIESTLKPSDEEPPRSGRPAWERQEVNIDMGKRADFYNPVALDLKAEVEQR